VHRQQSSFSEFPEEAKCAALWAKIGDWYHRNGELEKANRAWAKGVEIAAHPRHSWHPWVVVPVVESLLNAGHFDRAASLYRQYCPGNLQAARLLVKHLVEGSGVQSALDYARDSKDSVCVEVVCQYISSHEEPKDWVQWVQSQRFHDRLSAYFGLLRGLTPFGDDLQL